MGLHPPPEESSWTCTRSSRALESVTTHWGPLQGDSNWRHRIIPRGISRYIMTVMVVFLASIQGRGDNTPMNTWCQASRGETTRTSDLVLPKHAHYQTVLHPDKMGRYWRVSPASFQSLPLSVACNGVYSKMPKSAVLCQTW